MLAKFDPSKHGGKSMAYSPVGKEILPTNQWSKATSDTRFSSPHINGSNVIANRASDL
jgi:hypothetical protein